MRIEDQIEKYRRQIAASETSIKLYIEQIDELKDELKKMGIKTDDIGRELRKFGSQLSRLKKREEIQLRKVGSIITQIERDIK